MSPQGCWWHTHLQSPRELARYSRYGAKPGESCALTDTALRSDSKLAGLSQVAFRVRRVMSKTRDALLSV